MLLRVPCTNRKQSQQGFTSNSLTNIKTKHLKKQFCKIFEGIGWNCLLAWSPKDSFDASWIFIREYEQNICYFLCSFVLLYMATLNMQFRSNTGNWKQKLNIFMAVPSSMFCAKLTGKLRQGYGWLKRPTSMGVKKEVKIPQKNSPASPRQGLIASSKHQI